MAQTVVGFFDNPSDAQTAVQKLQDSGISRDRIDVSTGTSNLGTTTGTSDMGTSTGASTLGSTANDSSNATMAYGSEGGSMSSGSTSSGSSNTSNESGITRFFKSLFGADDNDADRYSRIGQGSQAIVTVHAQSSDEAERAADILDDNGAIDVDERSSEYGYTSGNTGQYAMGTNTTDVTTNKDVTGDTTSIPKIEEELQVGKRTVQTGGVRVRSRIVEKPVEENVRLREEYVRVERNPVNRKVTDADLANFQEKNIELVERAEVPVVNKEARVVEEINLSKEVNERNETVRDTVRNTEIDIENIARDEVKNRTDKSDIE